MNEESTTLGVVLAGGRARRLGGGDKALRRLAGRTLLEHVAARLAPQCRGLLVNANGDAGRFGDTGGVIVPDDLPDRPGPLAGILAALDWAAARAPGMTWLVSVPVDTPFVPRDLVRRLHAARREAGAPLACAASLGRLHPVVGLWPVAIRTALRRAIVEEGEARVSAWAARQGVATATWEAEPFDPFFNVNTPDDLALAERLAHSSAS